MTMYDTFRYSKDVDINYDADYDVDKNVESYFKAYGNLATSDSVAQAYGDNTLTETESYTFTAPDYSESFSGSISGTY